MRTKRDNDAAREFVKATARFFVKEGVLTEDEAMHVIEFIPTDYDSASIPASDYD